MNRCFAFIAAACVFAVLASSSALTQAAQAQGTKPATAAPTTGAPAAPAKWVPPVKGEATIDYEQSKATRAKKGEIHTKMKVRNTSKGSIALLSVEELWYDTSKPPQIASNGIYRHRALLNPNEVIEFTIVSLDKPNLYTNMLMFKHANGPIKPNKVKKIE
jgi:hypothetical protein